MLTRSVRDWNVLAYGELQVTGILGSEYFRGYLPNETLYKDMNVDIVDDVGCILGLRRLVLRANDLFRHCRRVVPYGAPQSKDLSLKLVDIVKCSLTMCSR